MSERYVATFRIELARMRPLEEFLLYGHRLRVRRQARRTTFADVVAGPLEGARIQLKHSKVVDMVIASQRAEV